MDDNVMARRIILILLAISMVGCAHSSKGPSSKWKHVHTTALEIKIFAAEGTDATPAILRSVELDAQWARAQDCHDFITYPGFKLVIENGHWPEMKTGVVWLPPDFRSSSAYHEFSHYVYYKKHGFIPPNGLGICGL